MSLSRIELNEHMPPKRPGDLRLTAPRRDRFAGADGDRQGGQLRHPLAADAGARRSGRSRPDRAGDPEPRRERREVRCGRSRGDDRGQAQRLGRRGHGGPPARRGAPLAADARPGADQRYVALRSTVPVLASRREHLPRLTERFYRVDGHRASERPGTGLGLAIVKHIVNRHRGRLTITSRVNQGSSFVAVVPLEPKTKA